MSDLIQLNKYELISRLQTTNRENHKLKTLLLRHQLLAKYYKQLYENCVHINGLKSTKNSSHLKNSLKSNESKLLTQIQTISKCDKSVEISLTKLQMEDNVRNDLFFEKSTQYEVIDNLSANEKTNISTKCVENDCHLVTNCIDININDNSINFSNESSVNNVINVELNANTTDLVFNLNDSQTHCSPNDVIPDTTDRSDLMPDTTDRSDVIPDTTDRLDNKVHKSIDKSLSDKKLKTFVCNYCHKSYKIKKSLEKHVNSIHKYIRSESKLENHINNNEATNGNDLSELKIKPKSNDMIVCQYPECKLKFRNRTHFLRHYLVHNESRKLCSDCGLRFDDSNQLREHMISHSNSTQSPIGSEPIGADLRNENKTDLPKHCSKTPKSKRFSCHFPNCNYKTANYNNLEVHQKMAHEKVYISL